MLYEPLGKFDVLMKMLQTAFEYILNSLPSNSNNNCNNKKLNKRTKSNESINESNVSIHSIENVKFDRETIKIIIKIIKVWEEFLSKHFDSYLSEISNQTNNRFEKISFLLSYYLTLSDRLSLMDDENDYLFVLFNQSVYSFLGVVLFDYTDLSNNIIIEFIDCHFLENTKSIISDNRLHNYINLINQTLRNDIYNENIKSYLCLSTLNCYVIANCLDKVNSMYNSKITAKVQNEICKIIKEVSMQFIYFVRNYLNNEYSENNELINDKFKGFLMDKESIHNDPLNKMFQSLFNSN